MAPLAILRPVAARSTARMLPRVQARKYSEEPPRSQTQPAGGGVVKDKSMIGIIGAAGLGLGAVFFTLMSSPRETASKAIENNNDIRQASTQSKK